MLESVYLVSCSSIMAAGLCQWASFFFTKRQRTEKELETERIRAIQRKIDAALQDEGLDTGRDAFRDTLKTASLTTELQRPRLQNLAKVDKQPPEKYKIMTKLASLGMDAEEIAAILGISSIEAGQLLSLTNMAKCGQ